MKPDARISDNKDNLGNMIDLFNLSHTGLWKMDSNDRVFFYNPSFYGQFDIADNGSCLEDWITLIHPEDREVFRNNVKEHRLTQEATFVSEYRILDKSGQYVWIEAKGIGDLTDGQMIGTHTDITTRKGYEDKLYNQAYSDKLTALPNANKLIIDIEKDISDNKEGSLLFIDLSHLNHMLTVYGQAFIDRLVTRATTIIRGIFAETFQVYRFIPFVFSFKTNKSVNQDEVWAMCLKLVDDLSMMNNEFDLSSEVIYKAVMMSYPLEEYFPTCEDMFNRFFLTFEQMDGHEKTFQVYTKETKDQLHRKMFIETHLIKALEDKDLFPVFQPIVSLNDEGPVGFEALCRWHDAELGLLFPDEFIPPAEKSGAIIKIGERMLDSACSFIRSYNDEHKTDLSVSVNASVVELMNTNYYDHIRETLRENDLQPANLTIEITESLILEENVHIIEQLEKLKKEGVGIAIDDFGTGYSSVNTMFSTPITEVKIDREVMLKICNQPMVFDFIQSLVKLCHKYDILVVGEGIEDLEMMEKSRLLNMNYLQGYKFSRPLTQDKAMKYRFGS